MKRKRKTWLYRCASAAILATLIGGNAWAASYNQGLTGSTDDASWLTEGTVSQSGNVITYDFGGTNQTFTSEREPAAYLGSDPNTYASTTVIINNAGGTLYLTGTNSINNDINGGRAIAVEDGGNVTINSNLNLSATGDYIASGISASRGGTGEGAETHLTINGNVKMRKDNPSNPWAGWTNNIHGNYDANPSFGAPNYTGARWAPAAIRLAEQDGSTITINGDLDLAWKGTGISTDAYYTRPHPYDEDTVTLNGNVRIETPVDSNETYYALANYGGTINVNATQAGPSNHDVVLLGNIFTIRNPGGANGGDPFYYQNGRTNIGLTTENSKWEGVIDNAGKARSGETNVWLQNGAVWNHHSRSRTDGMQVVNMPSPSKDHYGKYNGVSYVNRLTGGTNEDNAGWIYQNDSAKLEIANYSGVTNIVYAHSGNGTDAGNYTAGDVTIKNAAAGSQVSMVTDSSGISMSDDSQKSKVLNALAQKLTYSAYTTGERNLTGKVRIASGLTSSASAMYVGDISFNNQTGKGGFSGSGTEVVKPNLDFTDTLTGVTGTQYDAYFSNGTYDFGKGVDVTVTKRHGGAAVDAQADFKAVTKQGELSFTSNAQGNSPIPATVKVTGGHSVSLEAETVNVSMDGSGSPGTLASGISVGTMGWSAANELDVKGDLNVHVTGDGNVMGMYVLEGGKVVVDGDVTMKGADGGDGVTTSLNPTGDLAHYHANGIYAGFGKSDVTVNGNVDLAVKGTGIQANSGASVSVTGGGKVVIAKNSDADQYALVSEAATVRMNVNTDDEGNATGAGSNDVTIKGNLGLLNKNYGTSPNAETDPAKIDLGLSTDASELTGIILNEYREQGLENADTTLYLSNGAVWNNEAYGKVKDGFTGSRTKVTGGSDMDHAGYIVQKDANQLTIDQYSGSMKLVYAHSGDGTSYDNDYAAGDTKILDAADGSQITIFTDSAGINTEDIPSVERTMSALANKLWYMKPAEKKLKAKVQVASGLTKSSKGIYIGDMWFIGDGSDSTDNPENPVNPSNPDNPDQPSTPDTQSNTITGVRSVDTVYENAGNITGDGQYVFTRDTVIDADDAAIKLAEEAPAVVTVSAPGHTLTLNTTAASNSTVQPGSKKLVINAGQLNLNAKGSNRPEGIHVSGNSTAPDQMGDAYAVEINGDTNITAAGDRSYTLGVYTNGGGKVTFNGNLSMKGEDGGYGITNGESSRSFYEVSGLYAGSSYANNGNGGGHIVVNGDVDLNVQGTGAFVNGDNSTISLQGGTISIEKNDSHVQYSLLSQSGTIDMNVEKDAGGTVTGAGTHKVSLAGNIAAEAGAVNANEPNTASVINLGLSTNDSTWQGVAYNAFGDAGISSGGKTFTGALNVWLQNGASWTNEAYGATNKHPWTGEAFNGSHVAGLAGGTNTAAAGNIFQNDANNLTIDNYSGYTNIFYAHTDDGTTTDKYAAGDTIIKKAAAGSGVTLITDNSGITTSDDDMVGDVLNALAGKLYYNAYATGERNLSGTVAIASGLTASASYLKTGDIEFMDSNGQGTYPHGTPAPEQTETAFSNTITGKADTDTVYKDANVLQDDGTYRFTKDSAITVHPAGFSNGYGVNAKNNVTISAAGKNLTFDVKAGSYSSAYGIDAGSGKSVTITAKKADLTVDGGSSAAIGVRSQSGNVAVNGDLTVKVAKGNAASSYGLYSTKTSSSFEKGAVTVNGAADITMANGTGIAAKSVDSTATVRDGGTVTTNKESSKVVYALAADYGQIHFNMKEDGTAAGSGKAVISGNIGIGNGVAGARSSSGEKATRIAVGLNTEDSAFHGVVYNNFNNETASAENEKGYADLWLQNGASWTNEIYGKAAPDFAGSHVTDLTGGSSAATAGNIFQNDANKLTIDNYSGFTNVFYAHTDDGTTTDKYAAGDTVINKAASGSGVTLITDNSNISTDDDTTVAKVLNALAGKLYYNAYATGERNLSGTVAIASGLTASSSRVKTGNIAFNETSGQGSYASSSRTSPVRHSPIRRAPGDASSPYIMQIAESPAYGSAQRTYWDNQGIRSGGSGTDNTYTFNKDTSMLVSRTDSNTVQVHGTYEDVSHGGNQNSGVIMKSGDWSTTVAMGGHNLDITYDNTNPKNFRNAHGIYVTSGTLTIDDVADLNTTVKNSFLPTGAIAVEGGKTGGAWDDGSGNAKLIINNSGTVKTVLDGCDGDGSAIFVNRNSGSAELTISGNVDVHTEGKAKGIFTIDGNASIGGGTIKSDNYAIRTYGGKVTINTDSTDGTAVAKDATVPVVVKGDIYAQKGEKKDSVIALALSNGDSSFMGTVLNKDATVNLDLSNGGTWTNEAGANGTDSEFTGSHITNLSGGMNDASAGHIFQNDSRPLTIDNYSGRTKIYYAHSGSGTAPADYAAGDTIITHAAEKSAASLITDNGNIDADNADAVKKVLTALAGKLTYSNYASGERNLTAQASIASGLTASSRTLRTGTVNFADDTGRGESVNVGEVLPDNYGQGQYTPHSIRRIDGQQIETGEYETPMMKGVREAITSSVLSWRSIASEPFSRTKLIREDGEADGVWAKTYGGKYTYDEVNTNIQNSYKAAQVGFEKQNGSWHTGIAVDYRDGESTYKGNGRGDDTTYSIGVYGIREFKDGSYLDLAAKAGHLENEFDVYNEIGQKLSGTYKTTGWSATAQYGKRMGDEKRYVEPQAQLTFARLEGKNFTATSPALGTLHVNQDAIDSVVGRLGVEAGLKTGSGTLFGRASLSHEFAGDIDGKYSAADGTPKKTSFDLEDTWAEMTLGGRWNLSKATQVYADVTKSFTGDYRENWKINGGLKFNFSTAPANPAKVAELQAMESADGYSDISTKKETQAAAAGGTPGTSATATSAAAPAGDTAVTANLLATPEMVPAEASRPVYRGGKAAKAKAMADAAVEDSGYAETGLDEAGYDLTPIVVTASRTEKSLADAHADISVVGRKEIEQMHMTTVEEALRTVPGVQFLNYGQNGMNGNLSGIRLNGSKDIVILVDGVRVTDFQDVGSSGYIYSFLLNNMDNIERIEVLRGAAGTVYGSGAKGGVINIITRKINQTSTVVDVARGSFGKQVYHVNTQGRKGKFSYNAYYNADKRGDYKDGDGRRWPGHTDTKSDGVKLAYDLTPDHTVTFQYDWMDSKYNGQDLIYIGPYNGRYKSRMWSLTDDWKFDKHWKNKLTYRNNRLETHYGKPLGEGDSKGTVSAPYSVGSNMNYDFLSDQVESTDSRNTLVFGVDYSKARSVDGQHAMGFDEDGNTIYGDRSMKNYSYYIQDDWKLSPAVTLSGGVRHDKPNGDSSSPSIDSHTSKSYKLSFDLTNKDTFYAGRSDFYILPSLYQLYDEKYGNADLRPAEGRTTTIGYTRKFGEDDLLTVNWFETKSDRSIGYSSAGQYQNFQNGISRGWNAQYTKQINDNWNFRLGWAHLFANEGAGDTFSLGYYPKDMATFLIGYNKDKFGAALDGFYFIRRTNPANSDVRGWPSNKYGVYNLSMDYAPTKQMKFYLKVDNIFDKLWAEHTDVIWNGVPGSWYSQPGRTITLGMQYKF